MFKGFVQDARCYRYSFTWVLLLGTLVGGDRFALSETSVFVLCSVLLR